MDVRVQVRAYLAENFMFSDDGFDLGDDASLLEEGIVDSTGVLELVMFIEETFGVEVADEEIVPDNLDSISNLAGFIQRKQGSAGSSRG